ncbi:haloacid dehalogenase [Paenibacillus sp. Soil766]|uniref:HAD family hydrolase n=1 Tax=Paenibacillus sp. Soil766 TaxID=1736404 RepID=UPI00070BCD1C|nr:HAD family hydrolase [Paenibacillus sp. Soil766]KRE97944.1 haloacid dehalogenase [Paenibacillus sp. Soil766]
MAVLVFDLDDTLYDEITYVHSGFMAVSQFMNVSLGIPVEASYAFMRNELTKSGRGQVFNSTLEHFGFYTKTNVKKCISVYRAHDPQIELSPDAHTCLTEKSSYPIYIVTDGNKHVQNKKLTALGLKKRVKFCYITYRYGLKNSKPSPYVFNKICEKEMVATSQVIYIGDNPTKDFVGIKPLGFITVRIMKGNYKHLVKSDEYEADYQIQSLDELTDSFINTITNGIERC